MDRGKVVAILQARMSSTRLPGKVLRPILGRPMIELQLERMKRCSRLDELVVATSVRPDDNPLADLCSQIGTKVFRGSLENVLDRFYQAALIHSAVHVVRFTGDCPLIDPEIVDTLVDFYFEKGVAYATYCRPPSLPDGLDAEIFSFAALKTAWGEAVSSYDLEHVTPYIVKRPDRFPAANWVYSENLSCMRWTVDEPEDLNFVSAIFEALYPSNPAFGMQDVLDLLRRRPEIGAMNCMHRRKPGCETIEESESSSSREEKVMNIPKSMALQERAKTRIPGLSQLLSKRPDRFSYGVWPCYFSRAEGARVWDLDGNEYVDMSIGGIGATVLGYQDPDVDAPVKEAISRGVACSLNCPEEVELAELLCELHPWAEMVRFARGGGEAMAVAVRLARAATGREKVAFCGYHGWHDWYLAANLGTENALGEHLISGLDPAGVPRGLAGTAIPFSYNDIEALNAIVAEHGRELAAVILEPIRSTPPKGEFLSRVRELADSCGAALVVDEVSAGLRMNTGGAHLVLGLTPDVAVFSKSLGNGYAVAAIIGRSWVMEAAQKSFISSTNWTERIGPVAALATLKKHRAVDAGKHLVAVGEAVQAGWRRLAGKHGIHVHVSGIPPLSHFAFEVPDPLSAKAYFVQRMLEEGFLASTAFYSMYAHTFDHVNDYLAAVDRVFREVATAVAAGNIRENLRGRPAVSGFGRLA